MLDIKKCTIQDLSILKEIATQTFFDTYGEYNTKKDMDSYMNHSLSDKSLTEQLFDPYSLFYLAYDQQTLVGYLKLNYGEAQSKIYDENSMEIERIYILDQYQHRGFGSQLLHKSVATARELKKSSIWLTVWEENKNALRFYKKHQFEQITTMTFHLGEASPTGLVLQKKLIL